MKNRLLVNTLMAVAIFCSRLDASYESSDYSWGDCCVPCCSPFWVDVEYLYWQIKRSPNIHPLVCTGIFDADITPNLQTSGTKIKLGDRSIEGDGNSGIKFSAGFNLCGTYGLDASYTYLGKKTKTKSVQSNDFHDAKTHSDKLLPNSYLAIPFFDLSTLTESSVCIAKPKAFAGKAQLRVEHWMQGAECNFSMLMDTCECDFQVRALTGFRYWNFHDELTFTTDSPSTVQADVFATVDQFKTNNSFYGAQVGLDTNYTCCNFFCNAIFKIAFGGMNERLRIKGALVTNDFNSFGPAIKYCGGCFAQNSNIGKYEKTQFAYIPEVNLNIGYRFCEGLSIKVGYTFIYVSKIWWAENQLNPKINPTQSAAMTRTATATLSGIDGPKALQKSRDFWVQGVNVGLNYQF